MFEVPTSFSPSRVEKFTSCPLAFRFASIEKLPERANDPHDRGLARAPGPRARLRPPGAPSAPRRRSAPRSPPPRTSSSSLPDLVELGLDDEQMATLDGRVPAARRALPARWRTRRPSARSASSCASPPPAARSRSAASSTASTCATTASSSSSTTRPAAHRRSSGSRRSLAGVHFYSFLCEQVLGRRPAAIRLMYLSTRRDHRGRAVRAVDAVRHDPHHGHLEGRRAAPCATDDFRPRPGALCAGCSFQTWCPAFGGDPDAGPPRGAGIAPGLVRDGRDVTAEPHDGPTTTPADPAPGRRARRAARRSARRSRRFDRWADAALERVRGNPVADTVIVDRPPRSATGA